jgi:hypothetical protein
VFAILCLAYPTPRHFVADAARKEVVKTRWEYKVIGLEELLAMITEADKRKLPKEGSRMAPYEFMLNKLGDEGWELVMEGNAIYYFKRSR